MLEIKFNSIFKEELNGFIKYKKALGYDYEQEIYVLKKLDNNFLKLHMKKKIISKEMFSLLSFKDINSITSYKRYYCILKDFCIYLISLGYKNIYYINKKFKINNNYIPIIFNDKEIKILFKTLDKYNFDNTKYAYSIIIRLMYSCGLRISEAFKIKEKDINFNDKTILIIDSKRHVSRIVVLSNSMNECLHKYIETNRPVTDEIFGNLKKYKLREYYKIILKEANLNEKATLHCLRHVFANKAFNQMLEKNFDENVVLAYLHNYMGHKTITETIYYLHFTDYNKNKLIEQTKELTEKIYEGVVINNE